MKLNFQRPNKKEKIVRRLDHIMVEMETKTAYVNPSHLINSRRDLYLNGFLRAHSIVEDDLHYTVQRHLKTRFYENCKVVFKHKQEKVLLVYNK